MRSLMAPGSADDRLTGLPCGSSDDDDGVCRLCGNPPVRAGPSPRASTVGARDRSRTGTAARPRDFHAASAFAAGAGRLVAGQRRSWSGARLHHRLAALGARRLLSTPSPLSRSSRARGLARRQLGGFAAARAFTEFDGCHLRRFHRRAQFLKSLVSTCFTTRAARRVEARAGVEPAWTDLQSAA